MNTHRFFCLRSPLLDTLQLYVSRRAGGDLTGERRKERAVLTWERLEENTEPGLHVYQGPTLDVTDDEARHLMDAMWNLGVRPTNVAIEIGALPATRAHLEDMRRLVFERAGVKKTEPQAPPPKMQFYQAEELRQ